MRLIFMSFLLFSLSGCSIYHSQFQKGGEMTSDFLERIQENPNGEDVLLPPKEKEKNG